MRRLVPLTALAAAALAVTACAPSEGTSAAAASPTGGPCSPDQLQTLEPGTLTAATDPTCARSGWGPRRGARASTRCRR
jgi:polar amino acid transport system substrate-binding protein